jgi:hypothetical protein
VLLLRSLSAAALVVLAGCERSSTSEAAAAERPTHVDSVISREEALYRFQASTPPVDSLSGGVPTRDSLVRAFVSALAKRDSSALRRLLLDRSEFAYLYYPTNPQGLPPYDLRPDLLWFLVSTGSEKGLGRALEKRGGQVLGFSGYQCDSLPSREGGNVVWGPCSLRLRGPHGGTVAERLFGLIVERDGRYKFVSYANRL